MCVEVYYNKLLEFLLSIRKYSKSISILRGFPWVRGTLSKQHMFEISDWLKSLRWNVHQGTQQNLIFNFKTSFRHLFTIDDIAKRNG